MNLQLIIAFLWSLMFHILYKRLENTETRDLFKICLLIFFKVFQSLSSPIFFNVNNFKPKFLFLTYTSTNRVSSDFYCLLSDCQEF